MKLTRKELATRLGVSVSTLRKYEDVFAKWVETPKGVKGQREAKKYTDADVKLFSVIVAMRDEGIGLDDIPEQLDERLATTTSELIPAEPLQRETSDSVELALYMDTRLALEATEGELTATREERDYLRQRIKDMERLLSEEVERRAKLEGKLEALQLDAGDRPPLTLSQRIRVLFGGGDS